VEFKSACIGTTFALESLSYWASSDEEDKMGVVVASDVAKYPLHSSGEYTQGAGSTAMLIKKNPRLISLEQIYGSFTRDENDFFRPIGCTTAVVNGKHSNSCYLDAIQGAFDAYARKALQKGIIKPEKGKCVTDYIDHILFHIPYPRMVEYASAAIFRHDWKGLPRLNKIESEIGKEPDIHEFSSREDYLAKDTEYGKRFAKSMLFQEAFNAKARDSTFISRQVGNIYTGSIYLGLLSLIEQQKLKSGERVCFGAYGSGCSSLVFSGLVQPFDGSSALRNVERMLLQRREITLHEYEMLHEGKMKKSILPPSAEFALASIDEQGYRHYEYMS
jgi:hydroxymethylglutaryl-CoA synthase